MMNKLYVPALIFSLFIMSCSSSIVPKASYDVQDVFGEYWTFVDEHFIFFESKQVDWDVVLDESMRALQNDASEQALFEEIKKANLALLDGHSRGSTPLGSIRGYDYTQGYEVHFSKELVFDTYATREVEQQGNVYHTSLEGNIGYVFVEKFRNFGTLSSVIKDLHEEGVEGLVIDLRNNSGGDSNPVPELLGNFVEQSTILGYYIEKTGPNLDDITDPISIAAEPSGFLFDKPTKVLINRACYSATSYFAAMIKDLTNVELIGQITGGGAGGNLGYQLSNGWVVATSVSDFLDKNMESIEEGVFPDIEIANTAADIENGVDRMLEQALAEF